MVIIFSLLLKIDEKLMSIQFNYKSGNFVIPLLIFISQFSAGFFELKLIQKESEIIQSDNQIKIYTLVIFASYFNYIGSLIRKKSTDFQLENRTRGFQIIFCSILCYFTIRAKIYKHQFFALIIIFIIIIIISIIDSIFIIDRFGLLISYGYGIFSCFSRAFLDTIENYLFEFGYLNPYKVLMLEGFIWMFVHFNFFFRFNI